MRGPRILSEEQGQAIVEYILILVVAITAIGLFIRGFRVTLVGTWRQWNQEVAAPCPGCAAPIPPE